MRANIVLITPKTGVLNTQASKPPPPPRHRTAYDRSASPRSRRRSHRVGLAANHLSYQHYFCTLLRLSLDHGMEKEAGRTGFHEPLKPM
jgi:hypothetical protein